MARRSGGDHGHPWHSLTAVLTTRHGKAYAIARALRPGLGLEVVTHPGDTDALGTFSGEVERQLGPQETALAKARLGAAAGGHRLLLASEGSFGPHPEVPFVTVDQELVVLLDRETGHTVTGHATSLATTTFSTVVAPDADLDDVLARADAPRHRLVVRPEGARATAGTVHKGIVGRSALARAVAIAAEHSPSGAARVETDLRAHVCPSRREVIARAAEDLAARAARLCPGCGIPGWGPQRTVRGAPCRACGTATSSVDHVVWACGACPHEAISTEARPAGGAEPASCPRCNP